MRMNGKGLAGNSNGSLVKFHNPVRLCRRCARRRRARELNTVNADQSNHKVQPQGATPSSVHDLAP